MLFEFAESIKDLNTLAQAIVDGRLVRGRMAPGVRPVNDHPAYMVQGGKLAGFITSSKTDVFLGVFAGAELWGLDYPMVFIEPPGPRGDKPMSVRQACSMLGVRQATFLARCSRSTEKAWPMIDGAYRQCSIASPYPHIYAYRVDPRGRWGVTLFEQAAILRHSMGSRKEPAGLDDAKRGE